MTQTVEIPKGYCQCGCGEKTKVATITARARGHIAGEPLRFIHGHNSHLVRLGYVVDSETGCWNSEGTPQPLTGYIRICFEGRRTSAHREAWVRANGPIPKGHVVHHRCGNRICVNPDHLKVMLASDHGRLHRSEQGPDSRRRLTREEVREVRAAPRRYGVQSAFARRFGVTPQTIHRIVHGRTYAEVV